MGNVTRGIMELFNCALYVYVYVKSSIIHKILILLSLYIICILRIYRNSLKYELSYNEE